MMNRYRYGMKLMQQIFRFLQYRIIINDDKRLLFCMFEVCEGQVVHLHCRNKASGLKCTNVAT